jgi:hypothetical protein
MAVIDLKNCTFYVYDGKALDDAGIVTVDQTDTNADLTLQSKIMWSPDAPVQLALVDPGGASESLAIAVVDRVISVTLKTGVGSAIETTALELAAIIDGDTDATALMSIAVEGDGSGVCEALAATSIGEPNSIEITIGDGNMTWSEKSPVEFKKNRGILDEVRLADEEPMDVSFEFTFDFIKGDGTGTPTVGDALKRIGDASAWKNASLVACRPNCVNLAVTNNPENCAGTDDEVTEIHEFYNETLDPDPSGGQVSAAGRANRKVAESIRLAVA